MQSGINKPNMHHLFIAAFVLAIAWTPVHAQKGNKSERYVDVYKKYLNATCPVKKTASNTSSILRKTVEGEKKLL